MASLRTAGIITGLLTGIASLTVIIGYSTGLFSSNTQINEDIDTDQEETIIKTTIKDKLLKEGFTLLDDNSSSEDWNAVLEDYKKATKKTFSGKKEENKELQALKDKCKEILSLEKSKDYSKTKMWCVKKEKMDEILKKAGFKVLSSNGIVAKGEKGSWKQKISKWKTLNSKPFNELVGKIKDTTTDDDAENIKLFRAECEKLKISDLDTTNAKFEVNFNLAKNWCSVKIKSSKT